MDAMTEPPLPTRLRAILSRRPRTEQQVEAYVEDLEQIIRAIETAQMEAQRQLRRREPRC
jgi:hypothetical protein